MDRVARIIGADPTVNRVYERIGVGSGSLNINLKKDRPETQSAWQRRLGPQLAAIPDARVNFISQSQGGPESAGGGGRDITLYLAGDDPTKLEATAEKVAAEMQGVAELRAPRVQGNLYRPEIVIKPRFDLAAVNQC